MPNDIPGRASAIRRFADALLRSGGNTQVIIRIPDPSTGDTSSQLGLEPPTAGDLPISPAIVTALEPTADGRRRLSVLLGANSLAPIARQYGVQDIAAWLRNAQGILYYGHLMPIDAVIVAKCLGADCLYRLTATE